MEKNLIWAVVISTVFLMVWYRFFSPPAPRPAEQAAVAQSRSAAAQEPEAELKKPEPLRGGPEKVTEKTLETAFARIAVNSQGAAVRHWWVKETKKKPGTRGKGPDEILSEWTDLVNPPQKSAGEGQDAYPLATFSGLNFREIPAGTVPESAVMSAWGATLPSGLQVEKRFALEDASPDTPAQARLMTLTLTFKNPGKSSLKVDAFQIGWDGGLATVESEAKENAKLTRVLAYPSPTKEAQVFKKPAEEKMGYKWAGIDNRYYLFAMLPQLGKFDALRADKSKTNPGSIALEAPEFMLNPGESKTFALKLYGGPKGYTQLKKLNLGLEWSVDFGYFGFLGKWALRAMNALYKRVGNYGWAIVILTICLQAIVLPLSIKSYKSMAAMKKLQPKIQELQKRYKSDPKRMNQEMLNLYKESKTNPFGGCLPMLLQLPVFWAFFTMLRNSYELRGAPWILWVRDLSQHDPYYVLPIVMGGGMFLQQKISGSAADPTQAQMAMMMPVVFTFMFLKFPSGLVLYWLTNSLVSILSQYFITRQMNVAPAPAR